MKHPRRNVDERGAAALYALDAIEAKEARAFETRLATGTPVLRDEVDALRETAAALALQATPEAPAAGAYGSDDPAKALQDSLNPAPAAK